MPYVFRRPMAKDKPEDNPFAYNRGAIEAETRRILQQNEGMTYQEKQNRLQDIMAQFNLWLQNNYEVEFKKFELYDKKSNLYDRSVKLKKIIMEEIEKIREFPSQDSYDQESLKTLQQLLEEIERLDL